MVFVLKPADDNTLLSSRRIAVGLHVSLHSSVLHKHVTKPGCSFSVAQADDIYGRQPVAIATVVATHPAAAACGDAPRAVPLARWDVDDFATEKAAGSARLGTRFGAFVDEAELFDAAAFNISR